MLAFAAPAKKSDSVLIIVLIVRRFILRSPIHLGLLCADLEACSFFARSVCAKLTTRLARSAPGLQVRCLSRVGYDALTEATGLFPDLGAYNQRQ
jgi:hypothetical protein